MAKGQRYQLVFPGGTKQNIDMLEDETGFIKDVLDDRVKELCGSNVRDLTSEAGWKLLYLGPIKTNAETNELEEYRYDEPVR